MAKEIERKFLLKEQPPFENGVMKLDQELIKQGYIFSTGDGGTYDRHLRIRIYPDRAEIGLKFTGSGIRDEYEYEVPMDDAVEIYGRCELTLEKYRRSYDIDGEHYDFDRYVNGIEVLEVEFKSMEAYADWTPPSWIGEEITDNAKYSNIVLAKENLKFNR